MLVMNKMQIISAAFITVTFAIVLSSCGDKRTPGLEYARNMYDPIAYNPDQKNPNFKNGITAQTPPEGTTPVGFERFDYPNTKEGYEAASTGITNPLKADKQVLQEGAVLYKNMCSHCHGEEGKGNGSIVQQGKFPPPPSYSSGTSSRGGAMKDLTDGKIFHTITYGVNLMGPHASQLSPSERWKVVMYVHQLQKLK